jgi:pyridoxal phosphate enzyme (YggS family)
VVNKHPTSQEEVLAENITAVREQIAVATERVGRLPAEVTLVAVSKTKPLELVRMAYDLGLTDFGENWVQEALAKIADFDPTGIRSGIRWHMIGHVQSNKAGKVVGSFACIHSVDSLHIAQALNQHAEKASQATATTLRQSVLLQVNISGEQSKEGMSEEETPLLARQIVALPHLDVQGLMTVAPLVQDPEEVRPVFRRLRELNERLRQEVAGSAWQHLSMGMTDDYRVAIEEGATIVRVGRAVFGERIKKG